MRSPILLHRMIRSLVVEDECHVVHLLCRESSTRMVGMHLKYVHAGARDGMRVGHCCRRWKEILLCAYSDKQSCEDQNKLICAHERLHFRFDVRAVAVESPGWVLVELNLTGLAAK
jgi:hypothetical protein